MSDGSALQHDGLADGGSPSKSRTLKSVTVAAAGLIAATTLLAGCGEPKAAPMNDEYAGNSGETEKSQESESQSSSGSDSSSKRKSTTSDKKDTGNYKDGTDSINGRRSRRSISWGIRSRRSPRTTRMTSPRQSMAWSMASRSRT